MVASAANTGLQAAGTLALDTTVAGNIVANSVVFTPAASGGRALPPAFREQREGYVRGADLWHLACALYVAASPGELTFLTLDERQRTVAKALGFKT